MFGELPKLLERNFALGFFLPSAIFLTMNAFLLDRYGKSSFLTPNILKSENKWLITLIIIIVTWLFALFLLALNRSIYRLKEGYGFWNHPKNPLIRLQIRRYTQIKKTMNQLREEVRDYEKKEETPPGPLMRKYIRYSKLAAIKYPQKEEWILPLSFGNTLRAFETYSFVMYGFDAISGWPHLLSVMPKDYRQLIDGVKANLDFWINIWFLSFLFLLEYIVLSLIIGSFKILLCPIIVIFVIILTSFCAQQSASSWGALIKAAFDVFMPELSKKLRFKEFSSREEERKNWTSFSQAILYRLPEVLPKVTPKSKKNQSN